MPITKPAASVTHSERSWPMSAAASAGMTRKVSADDVEADEVGEQQAGDAAHEARAEPRRRLDPAHRNAEHGA